MLHALNLLFPTCLILIMSKWFFWPFINKLSNTTIDVMISMIFSTFVIIDLWNIRNREVGGSVFSMVTENNLPGAFAQIRIEIHFLLESSISNLFRVFILTLLERCFHREPLKIMMCHQQKVSHWRSNYLIKY